MPIKVDGETHLTIEEAARELKVHSKTLRSWINAGVLPEPPVIPSGLIYRRYFTEQYLRQAEKTLEEYRRERRFGKTELNKEPTTSSQPTAEHKDSPERTPVAADDPGTATSLAASPPDRRGSVSTVEDQLPSHDASLGTLTTEQTNRLRELEAKGEAKRVCDRLTHSERSALVEELSSLNSTPSPTLEQIDRTRELATMLDGLSDSETTEFFELEKAFYAVRLTEEKAIRLKELEKRHDLYDDLSEGDVSEFLQLNEAAYLDALSYFDALRDRIPGGREEVPLRHVVKDINRLRKLASKRGDGTSLSLDETDELIRLSQKTLGEVIQGYERLRLSVLSGNDLWKPGIPVAALLPAARPHRSASDHPKLDRVSAASIEKIRSGSDE